jgi:hypothetical protein
MDLVASRTELRKGPVAQSRYCGPCGLLGMCWLSGLGGPTHCFMLFARLETQARPGLSVPRANAPSFMEAICFQSRSELPALSW